MNWPATPTLAGQHVTLRPIDRADRDGLLAAFADGFEYSFASMVPGAATIDGWFDAIEREYAANRARVFTVLDAQGQIAGTTRFLRMNIVHRRAELGGTLYAPWVRRTGLNTEAKRMLLSYAFEILDVRCVQIRTDFLNVASRRAIERLGARQDGILRGHMVVGQHSREGERSRDTVVYSILAHEWPGVRRHLDGCEIADRARRPDNAISTACDLVIFTQIEYQDRRTECPIIPRHLRVNQVRTIRSAGTIRRSCTGVRTQACCMISG